MEYNKPFLDTYKKFISKGWYDSIISTATLERWCENFSYDSTDEFDPKICAHFLLESLIFYQEKQIEAIIVQIQDEIKSELNQYQEELLGRRLSETELQELWEEYKKQSYVVAAALPEDTGDSAHQASRMWRNATGIDTGSIVNLIKVIKEENKKHIFFVDDFVGTGTKLKGFLTNHIFPNKSFYGFERVNEVINEFHTTVDFNVAVFALYENGKSEILKDLPQLKFYFGDIYTDEYNLISENCVLYDLFEEHKQGIIEYIKNKVLEFNNNNKYALNLPISFHHGCPNNSLSLYYNSTPNWNKLIPESHPKKHRGE